MLVTLTIAAILFRIHEFVFDYNISELTCIFYNSLRFKNYGKDFYRFCWKIWRKKIIIKLG